MVSFDLTGKVAVITGANGGLGLDIAEGFAEYGADIAIVARNREKAERAKEILQDTYGRRTEIYLCDVRKTTDIRKTVSDVLRDFGKIDILVNNSGIMTNAPEGPHSLSEEDWDKTMETNVKGYFFMASEVYKCWMKDHGGKIINVGSNGGILGAPTTPAYNISKAAIPMMTNVMAMGWAKSHVMVNTLSPGVMEGGMSEFTPRERMENFARKIPQNRCGNREDLKGAAIFLASDANTYCQGANIVVDGGCVLPLD